MEYVWLVLAIVCALVGVVGSVLPMLPGPPICYVALWMMWLRNSSDVPSSTLWVSGILMVVITIIDYIAPVWLMKIGKGSPEATRWATIGLVVGVFAGPWGMILGPFVGALIGELKENVPLGKALKVASLSFLAFLLTTGLKLIYCIGVVVNIIFTYFWN